MSEELPKPKPLPDPGKTAFTIPEMVALGDGCRATIYKALAAGELRAVKRGRRTIILAEDRARWRGSFPEYRPAREPVALQGAAKHKHQANRKRRADAA